MLEVIQLYEQCQAAESYLQFFLSSLGKYTRVCFVEGLIKTLGRKYVSHIIYRVTYTRSYWEDVFYTKYDLNFCHY